jgi:hypothetical protein
MKAINYTFKDEIVSFENYDKNKITSGDRILRYTSNDETEDFIGPVKLDVTRPDQQGGVAMQFVSVVTFTDTIDWVFYLQNTTSNTRRIALYIHDKTTNQYTYQGFISWTRIPTNTHTHRGFKVSLENYSEGTVSVNGTSVTGILTEWVNHNIPSGCRIGFGSKNPSEITTWYEIDTITNETSITIDTSVPDNLTNVDYIIQDLRAIIVTSATGVDGGAHLIKGLRPEIFTTGGTTVSSATDTDGLRRTYKLNGGTTNALNNPTGLGLDDRISWVEQNLYVTNLVTTTTVEVFVFNIRASLNPSLGIDNNAFQFRTGVATVFTTVQQLNSANLFTVKHGFAKDQPSLYFISSNRLYRAPLELIKPNVTNWIQDYMADNPPGGISTYPLQSFTNLSYCKMTDRIFLFGGVRSYYTKYDTSISQFESIFLSDSKTVNVNGGTIPINPDSNANGFNTDINSGYLHILRNNATVNQNIGYSIPLTTHQNFAFDLDEYLISPVFRIPEGNFVKMIPQYIRRLGNHPSAYFQPEPFRIFYRTKGITNNTGTWIRLNDSGDLTNVFDNQIQFAFTFKTLGVIGIPPRLKGILLTYESLMDYYKPSTQQTNSEDYIISWRQDKLFTGNIPKISIDIFDVKTSLTIIEDDTERNDLGIWEYSEDEGLNWNPWDSTKNQIGNLIRYRTTNLPKGIKLKVIIR